MNSLEESFKNRILLAWDTSNMGDHAFNQNFVVKWAFLHESKIYNPLSLNITNTFDLVEKLTPSLYFVLSDLEKIKNIDNQNHPSYNPDDTVVVFVIVYPVTEEFFSGIKLFKVKFKFSALTNVNIFQKK